MDENSKDVVYTQAAGLVLAHVYLQMLFVRLKLVDETNTTTVTDTPRALAVLTALAPSAGPRDPMRAVLLGVPLEQLGTYATVELSEQDQQTVYEMVDAIQQHTPPFQNMNRESFASTYFERDGRVRFGTTETHLTVEKQPYDMLLDQMPWSFNVVSLPWMTDPLLVTW